MKQLHFILFWVMSTGLWSQALQGIPYQAVMRNADGTVMSSTAMTITFKIHDVAATGAVVYEETHAVTSNGQGLVSMNVGSGTVVTGAFDNINWGRENKFLQVLMNAGNGNVDLGTQQMMSVPYALYAEDVNVRVSLTGDSLFIGNQVSIVPGVSAANPPPLFVQGAGVTDIDGNFYPSIIINGQEWMSMNLRVSKFSNGNSILNVLDDNQWSIATEPAYCSYDNVVNPIEEGYLYNGFSILSIDHICPLGWEVPTDMDWYQLINFLGGESIAGGKIKKMNHWSSPNIGATNSSGFSAVGTGLRYDHGGFGNYLDGTSWYTSTLSDSGYSIKSWFVTSGSDDILPVYTNFNKGYNIRCKRVL